MATNVGGGVNTSETFDDYDGHFVDPFEIVSSSIFIILGLATIWIYYRIANFHWRHGFKTNFQRIFFVLITNDILAFLAQLFDVRLPTWGVHEWYFYIQAGPIPTILNYLSTVTLMIQSFGTLLVAVNRSSSLLFPVHYEAWWDQATRPVCCVVILLPSLITIHCLFVENSFLRLSWGYYIPNANISDEENWAYFGINLGCLLLGLPLNFYLGYRLMAQRKKVKLSRREFAFHATTVFQFTMGFINAIDTIVCNTQSMDEYWIFFETAPIFCDLTNFGPLWFIFIVSKETRANVFGRKEESSQNARRSTNLTNSPRRTRRTTISAIHPTAVN